MKTISIITNAEVLKGISKLKYYSVEHFASDAIQYLKAIKERRMVCIIYSVSSSGMSRVLGYKSCQKTKTGYYYRNYNQFFCSLGYTEAKEGFRIGGCGMDMNFATNYNLVHKLHRLGFISKKECESLCQMTPTIL
jgi:hypothetical protein